MGRGQKRTKSRDMSNFQRSQPFLVAISEETNILLRGVIKFDALLPNFDSLGLPHSNQP
jgi:hypothetical protein